MVDLSSFRQTLYRFPKSKGYMKRYGQDWTTPIYDDRVADVLKAQGFSCPEKPRSIYRVEKLYECLGLYAPSKATKTISSSWLQSGIDLAYKCFANPTKQDSRTRRNRYECYLQPEIFDIDVVANFISKPKASAGLTAYGMTKDEAYVKGFYDARRILRGEKVPEPCIAYTRTQFDDKTRLVWGYPLTMTILEGLIAVPLINYFKTQKGSPMAFGQATGSIGAAIRVASYVNDWSYALDMSKFDSTISKTLIKVAFNILKTWFDITGPVLPCSVTVGDLFDVVERYFVTTPIVMPDGQCYRGKNHGVPSGSFFTQLIDSIVNVIIIGAISARFKLNVDRQYLAVLGDDSLFWSNRRVSLEEISAYALEDIGVRIHGSEKSAVCHYDEPIHFLGRIWDQGWPGLPEEEIIARMVNPERYRTYPTDHDAAQRQVRLLFLSFATVYRQAWRIADQCLNPNGDNRRGESGIDADVLLHEGRFQDFDIDHLSGLAAYLRNYVYAWDRANVSYSTGLQYWL